MAGGKMHGTTECELEMRRNGRPTQIMVRFFGFRLLLSDRRISFTDRYPTHSFGDTDQSLYHGREALFEYNYAKRAVVTTSTLLVRNDFF